MFEAPVSAQHSWHVLARSRTAQLQSRGRPPRLAVYARAAGKEPPSKVWPPPKNNEKNVSREPVLWGTKLRKSHDGERIQFDNLDLVLERGQKVAVVGGNGSGKSTLLRVLAGADTALDGGEVQVRKGVRVGFLSQEPHFPEEATALEALLSTDHPKVTALRSYRAAAAAADAAPEDTALALALAEAAHEMDEANAWATEAAVETAIEELGCGPFADRPCGALSGGQTKRLALASVLLQEPELLILDEPTNHLSVQGVEWLETRLADPSLTVLMVSHDRSFIDSVCNEVLELDGSGGAFRHSGNYTRFLEERENRFRAQEAAAANASTLLRKEAVWMSRQPKARQAKSKSRQDNFYALKDKAQALPERMGTIDLDETAVTRMGSVSVELKDVSLTFGSAPILKEFSYQFGKGERVALVGPNGAGKTTFLRICLGQQEVDSGEVKIGQTVKFGHYTQLAEFPDPTMRVADYVATVSAEMKDSNPGDEFMNWSLPTLLNKFKFMQGRQNTPLSELSGGEKRRLQLMTVLAQRPNFLVLDEPTNDLDLDTIELLEFLLQGFDGIVVVTGHDRAFIDGLAQHILVFEGGGAVRDFVGSFTELRKDQKDEAARANKVQAQERARQADDKRSEAKQTEAVAAWAAAVTDDGPKAAAVAKPAVTGGGAAQAPRDPAADRELKKLANNASKKIPKVEASLEKIEAEIEALDTALGAAGSDAGKAQALSEQRAAAARNQEELYAEYERLDELVRKAAEIP